MKFLVTGAGGQLGKEWVHYLSEKKMLFRSFNSDEFDITSSNEIKRVADSVKPDVIINCAAFTNVDQAEESMEAAFRVNETGVKNLIGYCFENGIKLVHFSTDYVFPGEPGDEKRYPHGYPEDAPKSPVNAYGKSKRAGEVILEQSSAKWLLIRVSWLCGRFGNNFFKTMLRLGSERENLDVVDDQVGSPTFTFDLVGKCHELLEQGQTGVFHVSCRGKLTWADFASEIFSEAGMDVRVNRISSEKFPSVAKRPFFSLLSNHKLTQNGLHQLHWKQGIDQLMKEVDQDSKNGNRW